MAPDSDQSRELKIALSQTLIGLAADGVTDPQNCAGRRWRAWCSAFNKMVVAKDEISVVRLGLYFAAREHARTAKVYTQDQSGPPKWPPRPQDWSKEAPAVGGFCF